jgi:hypothetical protein
VVEFVLAVKVFADDAPAASSTIQVGVHNNVVLVLSRVVWQTAFWGEMYDKGTYENSLEYGSTRIKQV